MEIVDAKKLPVLILENVKNLKSQKVIKTMKRLRIEIIKCFIK